MIVMKFGGTSVEDAGAVRRLIEIVKQRLSQQPVVVCSALAKVTDALLAAADKAADGNENAALDVLERLRLRHTATARDLLADPHTAEARLSELFTELGSLLLRLCELRQLSPRISDLVVSFGERLSSELVTAALQSSRIDSVLVDARTCIVADDRFTCAVPSVQATNERVRAQLIPLLWSQRVPVLGGFIAATANGETTTLGRGGSDLTAALVGAALDARRVEIWTDVNGICSTDPRLYPGARSIRNMSFTEAAELALRGAKVLHPATLIPAMEKSIPVYVLNSRNPSHPGTRIWVRSDDPGSVKGIAVKRGITLVEASAGPAFRPSGFAAELLDRLEANGCVPDLACISGGRLSIAVDNKHAISQLREHFRERVTITSGNRKAMISLVADDVRRISGLPAQVFATLQGIDVWLASPGASQRSFSLVVPEDDVPEAIHRLHRLLLDEPHCPSAFPLTAQHKPGMVEDVEIVNV